MFVCCTKCVLIEVVGRFVGMHFVDRPSVFVMTFVDKDYLVHWALLPLHELVRYLWHHQ